MNNRERLIIIGAGGHGKVVADIAEQVGYSSIAFFGFRQKNRMGISSSAWGRKKGSGT